MALDVRLNMRKHMKIAIAIVLVAVFFYVGPIVYGWVTSKPMYGCFGGESRCMCGHEFFILLEEDKAYYYVPGHDDKSYAGDVVREDNKALISYIDSAEPRAILSYEEGKHFYTSLQKDEVRCELPQVTNPWRTIFPLYTD